MTDIRNRAMRILDVELPPGSMVRSNVERDKFHRLTGLSQESLEQSWHTINPKTHKPYETTSCNGFVGWYGGKFSPAYNLHVWPDEHYLAGLGKRHAWIRSRPGLRPRRGDIVRAAAPELHVAIAIDFQGGKLNTAAGGRGGRSIGYDFISRALGKEPYRHSKLRGWVNLPLLYGTGSYPGAADFDPVPDWLLGWWEMHWANDVYYYLFLDTHQVFWTRIKPIEDIPIPGGIGAGMFAIDVAIDGTDEVVIQWNGTESVEQFGRNVGSSGDQVLDGTWWGLSQGDVEIYGWPVTF